MFPVGICFLLRMQVCFVLFVCLFIYLLYLEDREGGQEYPIQTEDELYPIFIVYNFRTLV